MADSVFSFVVVSDRDNLLVSERGVGALNTRSASRPSEPMRALRSRADSAKVLAVRCSLRRDERSVARSQPGNPR
jgi:hypothetical protein